VVNQRFGYRCLKELPPRRWLAQRIAICSQCLAADQEAYLRLEWSIGWVAVCPRHRCILTTRCPVCRKSLAAPTPSLPPSFYGDLCIYCGASVVRNRVDPADARVIELQERLIADRQSGVVDLPVFGLKSWPAAIAAVDRLLRWAYTGRGMDNVVELYHTVRLDWGAAWHDCNNGWGERYSALALFAWLLEDWPTHIRWANEILRAEWWRFPDLRSELRDQFGN
jgi:hypothetical protein